MPEQIVRVSSHAVRLGIDLQPSQFCYVSSDETWYFGDGDVLGGVLIGGTGVSDNLGDHTATQTLNMNAFDIEFTSSTVGVIHVSPDGTKWRQSIDNTGRMTQTIVP
jgi:hypothetical protein